MESEPFPDDWSNAVRKLKREIQTQSGMLWEFGELKVQIHNELMGMQLFHESWLFEEKQRNFVALMEPHFKTQIRGVRNSDPGCFWASDFRLRSRPWRNSNPKFESGCSKFKFCTPLIQIQLHRHQSKVGMRFQFEFKKCMQNIKVEIKMEKLW